MQNGELEEWELAGARSTLLAALKPLTEIVARHLAQGVSMLWPGSRAPSRPRAAERGEDA